MTQKPKEKFNLTTTLAMIIGVVIGSGIFFRVPLIIKSINGNLGAGIVVFLLASLGIVFGGLTIARFAKNTNQAGGIITYCEITWGKTLGYVAGWFQTVFYFPAISTIIVWVAANYTCALFGLNNILIDGTAGYEVWLISIIYLLIITLLNIFSTQGAGIFQNLAMYIKVFALILLGMVGLIFGQPSTIIQTTASQTVTVGGLFSAIVIVAYAFDGWLIAPMIAHEIKNAKRNLPLALTIAPLAITLIYLLYFLGASSYTGIERILQGTDPLQFLSTGLLGPLGFKIILVFIIISVLGTLNGVFLSYMRLPYSLAQRNELPGSRYFKKLHPTLDIPIASSILAFVITLIWLFLHFLSTDAVTLFNISTFSGLQVDNLPIVLNHIFYSLLYLGAMIRYKQPNKGWLYNYLIPILALIGAGFILYGGFTDPNFNIYLLISMVGIVAGLLLRPKKMI